MEGKWLVDVLLILPRPIQLYIMNEIEEALEDAVKEQEERIRRINRHIQRAQQR